MVRCCCRADVAVIQVTIEELAKQLGNVSQACKMMGYSAIASIASRSFTTQAASWLGELTFQEISRKKPVPRRIPQKVCRSTDELQAGQDLWIRECNEQTLHQGPWCFKNSDADLS
jgi:hypothetical protein